MGSSFLSEVDDTSILRTGALHRYHYPLTWLPLGSCSRAAGWSAATLCIGTFETCRPDLSMSVHRGRSEVTGEQSEQRDWRFRISSSGANDRFARPSFADYSEF